MTILNDTDDTFFSGLQWQTTFLIDATEKLRFFVRLYRSLQKVYEKSL